MDDVIALFLSEYFLTGLRLALVVLVMGVGAWFVLKHRLTRPLPLIGILIPAVLLGTLAMVEGVMDPAIIPSLLMMAAGVGLAILLGAPMSVQALAAVPGSIWLAVASNVTDLLWVRVMFALFIPIAGYLINDFELRHEGLGLGAIYYALATLGAFGAIPDTEWAVTLLAIAFVLTFLAWPRMLASLGPVGSFLAVTVLVWVTAQGGAPRPASIVGAIACLGLLILEPIIIAFKPRAMRVSRFVKRNWVGAILASVPQFMVVLICSRVAARFTSEVPALLIVAFVYAAVLVIGFMTVSKSIDLTEDAPTT